MQNEPQLTAITRSKMSAPTKHLADKRLLKGRILDFGCGKGFDTDYLKQSGLDITGYDPFFRPNLPQGLFDTIICNYVLNVLEVDKEEEVLKTIKSYLNKEGIAYITVRRDIKKEGYRKHGKGYTYQRNVELTLPSIFKTKSYEIYQLSN